MDSAPRASKPTEPAEPLVSRNAGIDLLRGLSILLVVLHHLGLRIPLRKTLLGEFLPVRLLNALNYNGYEAVFVFFVISGFLITRGALLRWGRLSELDLRAFYARRFSRIVPCLVALVAVLGALHLVGAPDYVIERPGQSLAGAIVATFGLHLNWYEGMKGYLPGGWDVLWSLSIEEVFYLGFPLACLLARRTWVLALALVPLALSLPWMRAALAGNEIWQEKAYLPGMSGIALGVLGALLAARWKAPSRAWTRALLALGTAGLVAVLFWEGPLWKVLKDGVMLWLTLSALALVLAFDAHPPRALRATAWLRAWGRMSYEIYLTHMFVVYAAVRLFRAGGGELRHGWLWYLPVVPLCGLLGWATERWLSVPCERWLRARLLPTASRAEARGEVALRG
ncbi:acyltransferase [Aggregicoccus sp. 17bor-14]|uniref:acyltransferase family protein n=1 Tax=Myxococcaceae TaxID=31 RepID=UPI00129CF6CE|nr:MULTISPECIES: acyltransferase [Myxococcaceae]MBF5046590.1 acyltransferase [Simulacricoccus sp. 17bor-14]MRI92301.1 acyltransferase [Aggregicoccus sp. 17bor-14]